jgi:dihydrofolate reductase
MINIIATIDSTRGLLKLNLHKIETYQSKKLSMSHVEPVREPFSDINEANAYFSKNANIWVAGGAELYKQALPYANRLYITQISGIFDTENYFPKFEDKFDLIKRSRIFSENGFEFQHQIWENKLLAHSQYSRNTNARQV